MKHLEFVSQWNERELPSAERVAQIAAHEQRIAQAASELKQFELGLFTPRLKAARGAGGMDEVARDEA